MAQGDPWQAVDEGLQKNTGRGLDAWVELSRAENSLGTSLVGTGRMDEGLALLKDAIRVAEQVER